jgi:RHS repeat-associated protein
MLGHVAWDGGPFAGPTRCLAPGLDRLPVNSGCVAGNHAADEVMKILIHGPPLDERILEDVNPFEDLMHSIPVVGPTLSNATGNVTLTSLGGILGDPAGTRVWFLLDEQRSTVAITNSTGFVLEGYEYTPYGDPVIYRPGANGEVEWGNDDVIAATSNYAVVNLYTGREWDHESGLYHYRTRYMSPIMGRFISSDTIGVWGDANNLGNGYAYVRNGPFDGVDPMGEKCWPVCQARRLAKRIAEAAEAAAHAAAEAARAAAEAAKAAAEAAARAAAAAAAKVAAATQTTAETAWDLTKAGVAAVVEAERKVEEAVHAANWAAAEAVTDMGIMAVQAVSNAIPAQLKDGAFWNCFGGVMGGQATSLAFAWGAGVVSGPVGLGFASAATGAAIGGAAASCWDDNRQDAAECMATNGAVMAIGAASLASSVGSVAARYAAIGRTANYDELFASVRGAYRAGGAAGFDTVGSGLNYKALMGC